MEEKNNLEGSTFEIKSYEPFVIGIVLNKINLDSIKKKLNTIFSKDPSFEVPSQPNNLPINSQVTIGLKKGVELKVNYPMQGISLESENPENVIEIFEEFLQILEENDYKPEFSVDFYDLTSIMVGKSKNDSNPQEIINNSSIISNLKSFKNMNPKVTSITLNSTNEKTDTILNVIIEPRMTNPNELYYMNLFYRTKELNDFKEFIKDLNKGLDGIIDSLEG